MIIKINLNIQKLNNGIVKTNNNYYKRKFESFLRSFGYRDISPIFFLKKSTKQINYILPNGKAMGFYFTILPFRTKKSYLYMRFCQLYGKKDFIDKIKSLAKNIIFNEKFGMGEVYEKVIYTNDPKQFTLEERRSILNYYIRDVKNCYSNGCERFKPKEGHLLISYPYGPKLNAGFSEDSMKIGTRQRWALNRRFGFGNMHTDGYCCGRYDQNLQLKPVTVY